MTRAPSLRRPRGRSPDVAALAILATVLHIPDSSAAPRSAYNGDAFTSAPNTPSADNADAVASQSGTYSYTFPIEVPPGRLGMQPTLGLTYRSDGAIYGGVAAGWSMDLPSIQLDTSDGILAPERKWVSSLSGGEELVPTNETPGPGVVNVYRARYDLGGLRYERYAAEYPYEWVVRAPGGAIFRLGRRDPDVPTSELALLARAEDAHGNAVEYAWSWQRVPLANCSRPGLMMENWA